MRLLLAAYCCSPDEGSEPWAGWSLALQAARKHDVTVLVEEKKFRRSIERFLRQHGPVENLTFEFIPERWWAHPAWACQVGYFSYRLWQRRALKVARRLHAERPFDAVQQSTIISFREPGVWGGLNVPLIWGPIGGTANVPPAMMPAIGSSLSPARWVEQVRSFINRVQLRSRRVRRALGEADFVVAATDETARDLQAVCRRPIPVISEITVPDCITAALAHEAVAHDGDTCEDSLGEGTANQGDRPALAAGANATEAPATAEPATVEPAAEPLRVLYSGRHEPRKGLPLLLDALAACRQPWQLRILGAGPSSDAWRSQIARRGLGDRTEWIGWVGRSVLAEQYRWADVFAFPSVRDTTGTVLLEALAAGVPVVGLDHQGVADVVTEEVGIRVPVTTPPETSAALTTALDSLACDRDRLARLSRAARRRADAYQPAAKQQQWAAVWNEAEALSLQLPRDVTGLSPLRARLRAVKAAAAGTAAGWAAQCLPVREAEATGVLNFHRIVPRELAGGARRLPLNVTPRSFERQMRGLLAAGWRGVTVAELVDAHATGEPLPRKTFALTFDDAFAGVHRFALPLLKELRIPATVFLATDFVGSEGPFPFDPWTGKGYGDPIAWRPLSRRECDDLAEAGWELAAHTATHRDFSRLKTEYADDLGRSVDWLAREFGVTRPSFSYPYGLLDDDLAAATAAAGCSCGLTTESRLVRPGDDPFWWGRFGVEDGEHVRSVSSKLTGWFEAARGCWRRVAAAPATTRVAAAAVASASSEPCIIDAPGGVTP